MTKSARLVPGRPVWVDFRDGEPLRPGVLTDVKPRWLTVKFPDQELSRRFIKMGDGWVTAGGQPADIKVTDS